MILMKNVFALFIVLNSIMLFADEVKNHNFNVGLNIMQRDYREEEIKPGFKSNENGVLPGLILGYEYTPRESIYFGTDLVVSGGETDYDGGLQDRDGNILPGSYKTKTGNSIVDMEVRTGYQFLYNGQFSLTPYIGVGTHSWTRDLDNKSVHGFKEEYNWSYFALGGIFLYQYTSILSFGIQPHWMKMIDGNMSVQNVLMDNGQRRDLGQVKLGNKIQYSIYFPIKYNVNEQLDLIGTPYYQDRPIGRSEIHPLGWMEPASETKIFGVKFLANFKF